MSNAGLIEGNFTGVSGPGSTHKHSVIGTNVPKSKFTRAGWTMRHVRDTDSMAAGSPVLFMGYYLNTLDFGAETAGDSTNNPVMTPEDAWNVDTKTDDGKPGTGKVLDNYWDTCTVATTSADIGAAYDLQVKTPECSLYFRQGF